MELAQFDKMKIISCTVFIRFKNVIRLIRLILIENKLFITNTIIKIINR